VDQQKKVTKREIWDDLQQQLPEAAEFVKTLAQYGYRPDQIKLKVGESEKEWYN